MFLFLYLNINNRSDDATSKDVYYNMKKVTNLSSQKKKVPTQSVKFPVDGQDLYRRVFEVALDGISICDTEAIHVDVNDALCKMLGYSYDEIVGRPVIETVHPDYRFHLTDEFLPKVRRTGWIRLDSARSSNVGT